jgi:hypothetical protein
LLQAEILDPGQDYISKNIIEAHEAIMWAENDFDRKEATFRFILPLWLTQRIYPSNIIDFYKSCQN